MDKCTGIQRTIHNAEHEATKVTHCLRDSSEFLVRTEAKFSTFPVTKLTAKFESKL